MPAYAALLRGINVGKRRVKMDVLQALFEQLEFDDVATLLASGNAVFTSKARSAAKLEQRIEDHLLEHLGYEVDTFVRTARELGDVVAHEPFGDLRGSRDTHTLHVSFLKSALPSKQTQRLLKLQSKTDQLHVHEREIYWLREGRLSDSTLWDSPEMRDLKLPTRTSRTVATVEKLVQLASKTVK